MAKDKNYNCVACGTMLAAMGTIRCYCYSCGENANARCADCHHFVYICECCGHIREEWVLLKDYFLILSIKERVPSN